MPKPKRHLSAFQAVVVIAVVLAVFAASMWNAICTSF